MVAQGPRSVCSSPWRAADTLPAPGLSSAAQMFAHQPAHQPAHPGILKAALGPLDESSRFSPADDLHMQPHTHRAVHRTRPGWTGPPLPLSSSWIVLWGNPRDSPQALLKPLPWQARPCPMCCSLSSSACLQACCADGWQPGCSQAACKAARHFRHIGHASAACRLVWKQQQEVVP